MIKNNNILSYDTIKLTLTKGILHEPINFIKHISKYIDIEVDKKKDIMGNEEVKFKGNLRNFYIYGDSKQLKVVGSINKYLNGNNLGEITLEEVKGGIKKLSNELHLPMGKSQLGRVDIGCNIIVSQFPQSYFYFLGELPLYNRRINNETSLYYEKTKGKENKILFYDKIEEVKKKNEFSSAGYSTSELLRIEMSIPRTEIRKVLKDDKYPTGESLYNPNFYINLCNKFWKLYTSIEKKGSNPMSYFFEDIKSVKDIEDRCICYASRYFDLQGELKQRFGNRKEKTSNDIQKHHQLQRRIRKALDRKDEFVPPQPLEKELDDKLKKVFDQSIEPQVN